ncbi:putative T7SS-secreted protein [Streptomyces sp. NPDC000151]|uniref:putative T7SS-secreted protein n=1 Tax=Streptomyces sp. NPDC000151 TaxID=3154244 RepID=UPI00331E7494
MSAPTVDDFPILGFVPCPGDYEIAKDVARQVRGTAEALGEISRVLKGADQGEWRGKAADSFRALLADDFRPKVAEAYSAFSTARNVLGDWAEYMHSHQKRARALESEAHDIKKSDAEKDGKGGSGEGKGASSGSGDDALADVKRRARELHAAYEEEGARSASRLKKALDEAPNEPGFWEKLGDTVGDALEDLADAVMDPMGTLKELAPLFKTLGDVAGFLSTVTGFLALVPGLQFLGAASLALAGVALVAHYLSAVGTTGSFVKALATKDVILDAVGFGLGKVGARLGDEILSAAKASGQQPRMVKQLGGLLAAQEVPQGYFQFARGTARAADGAEYSMGHSEFVMRTGQYFTTWTGDAFTAEGSQDSIETAGKLLKWDFGPLTNKDTVAPWAN